jgi:hypothetical protein
MYQYFNTFKNWRFDNVQYSFPTMLPLSYTAPSAGLIKEIGGLAILSVKSVGGLAIASVKNVGGLSNV